MNEDQLSLTFAALANPIRRGILARLAEGDATVGDLATPHNISAPAISKHLKVLEQAGLIERRIDAQWRRCHLRPEALQAAAGWITFYRQFWDKSFAKLDDFLQSTGEQHPESTEPSETHSSDSPPPEREVT